MEIILTDLSEAFGFLEVFSESGVGNAAASWAICFLPFY
jgi:hypothetical protein